MLLPLHSPHKFRCRICSQMPLPPQSRQILHRRWCTQIRPCLFFELVFCDASLRFFPELDGSKDLISDETTGDKEGAGAVACLFCACAAEVLAGADTGVALSAFGSSCLESTSKATGLVIALAAAALSGADTGVVLSAVGSSCFESTSKADGLFFARATAGAMPRSGSIGWGTVRLFAVKIHGTMHVLKTSFF